MSNYRRANTTGATYFFTVNTLRRMPILTEDPVRIALRDAVEKVRISHPFVINAWVLLPDHLHCIWTLPQGDAAFPTRWSMIKRLVSQACTENFGMKDLSASRIKRSETGIWQRRFWEHQIRDDNDFARHVDYIHWNPVKHGLVTRAIEWPYSTLHRYVKEGIISADWGVSAKLPESRFGE